MNAGRKPNQPKRTRKKAESDEKLQTRLEYGAIAESPVFPLVYLVKMASEVQDSFQGFVKAQPDVDKVVNSASSKLVAAVFAAVKSGDDKFFEEFGKILRIMRDRGANAADPVGATILQTFKRFTYWNKRPPTMKELLTACKVISEEFDDMEESQFRRTVQKELHLNVSLEKDVRPPAQKKISRPQTPDGEVVDVHGWVYRERLARYSDFKSLDIAHSSRSPRGLRGPTSSSFEKLVVRRSFTDSAALMLAHGGGDQTI